ncbi:N,N'-diacetyllegionaminic acid synthase [compost metagenome]
MSISRIINGENKSVYIIAEIGVNHNGSIKLAYDLIDKAIECGADAVKFQTFISGNLVTSSAHKAAYQIKATNSTESQLEMLKKLELKFSDFIELKEYCYKKKIDFLSTPFDMESADFLHSIDIDGFKIGSGDMNNIPFLRKIDGYRLPIILSTGMSNLEEVKYSIDNITKSPLALLHCTSEYPAPFNDVNLLAMKTMEKEFNKVVGYSDHTDGLEASLAAVALGAKIIEKHFTLDRNFVGPDHKASMEAKEFKQLVNSIRRVELLLGDGVKRVMPSEENTMMVARKSIFSTRKLYPGDVINQSDLTVKRPGSGLAPRYIYDFIGKVVVKEVEAEHCLSWDDVK